jgi:hypothetical protein
MSNEERYYVKSHTTVVFPRTCPVCMSDFDTIDGDFVTVNLPDGPKRILVCAKCEKEEPVESAIALHLKAGMFELEKIEHQEDK